MLLSYVQTIFLIYLGNSNSHFRISLNSDNSSIYTELLSNDIEIICKSNTFNLC